jgi:hypothetical protein
MNQLKLSRKNISLDGHLLLKTKRKKLKRDKLQEDRNMIPLSCMSLIGFSLLKRIKTKLKKCIHFFKRIIKKL